MPKGIAQEIKRLEEMLRNLKPKRTGPKIRRPVKTKPNAPGGSKPKRKKMPKKLLNKKAVPRGM
jgi:hypothetical protein